MENNSKKQLITIGINAIIMVLNGLLAWLTPSTQRVAQIIGDVLNV